MSMPGRFMVTITENREERYIQARCPENMSYADWIRSIRPDEAHVSIEDYYRRAT